jgi:hypothetical protein
MPHGPLSCCWARVLLLSLPQPFVRPQTGGQTDEGFRSLFGLWLDKFMEQSGSLCHEFG